MKLKNLSLQPTALLGELLGTFTLALVALSIGQPLVVGFALVVLVLGLGAISGAHLNPAVTFGLWSVRKIEGVKVPFYWAMQIAGALIALLVVQFFKGSDYGLSLASFGSFDAKLVIAEVIGAAIFTFAIAAAVDRKLADAAKSIGIGFALMTGLFVGGGLLSLAAQSSSTQSADDKSVPRATKVDGVVLNPAIALALTEKEEQQSQLQSLSGQAPAPATEAPASRFTLETTLGALLGGAIGMNLYMVAAGVNPFEKKGVKAKVTAVFKKGKKEIKKKTKK